MGSGSKLKVTFYGGVGTVTGSKYLVSSGKTKVLVDCGLFQGLKELRLRNWRQLPFAPNELDAVVLTHAHIDHSGSLPILTREGFRGPIYCTAPTRDLCGILLPDCGRIAEEDARYANRKGFSKHQPALPLYTEKDAIKSLARFSLVEPDDVFKVGDLRISLRGVGHILGACCVRIANANYALQFSGDIGRYTDLLETEPEPAPGGNWVVMESTYGDRCHQTTDPIRALADLVNKIIDRSGVLIIPSFAVGRAQTLLYCLYRARRKNLIPKIPIYVNSPMTKSVTQLYKLYPEWHRIPTKDVEEIFSIASFVGSPEESRGLNRRSGPMVIISASGMLTGGRVLHHLKQFGPDPSNMILLPGFQAAGTRGAALVAGEKHLKIHGESIPINAEVCHWDILSAHADQAELLQWLEQCETAPKKVFLVHGEAQASEGLRRLIKGRAYTDVVIPEYGSSYEL